MQHCCLSLVCPTASSNSLMCWRCLIHCHRKIHASIHGPALSFGMSLPGRCCWAYRPLESAPGCACQCRQYLLYMVHIFGIHQVASSCVQIHNHLTKQTPCDIDICHSSSRQQAQARVQHKLMNNVLYILKLTYRVVPA